MSQQEAEIIRESAEPLQPLAESPHSKRDTKFKSGNKIGPRFRAGESGNPGGLSKARHLTRQLDKQLPDIAEKLIAKALKRALKDNKALEMLWNRAEGPMQDENQGSGGGIKVLIINANYRPPRDDGTEAGS